MIDGDPYTGDITKNIESILLDHHYYINSRKSSTRAFYLKRAKCINIKISMCYCCCQSYLMNNDFI